MRSAARILLLAALTMAGCSLFRDSDVQVARITAIAAPDTVSCDSTFSVTFTAMLGTYGGCVLDHFEATYSSDAQLALRVWARDTSHDASPMVIVYQDLTLEARPTEPGEYLIIGHQPDGKDTLKTITVLP